MEHILGNLLMQLLLGIPLELVHKGFEVGMVYLAGVLAGKTPWSPPTSDCSTPGRLTSAGLHLNFSGCLFVLRFFGEFHL